MDRRLLAGAVVAPAVFVAVSVAASLVEPGYSIVDDHLSGLASTAAGTRWWMTAGFLILAAGVALVAVALHRRPTTTVAVALGIAAICVAAVGLFPRSCVEVSCARTAWHDTVHDLVSLPAYGALLIVPVLVARSGAGGPWGTRGLVVVAVVAALVVALVIDPGRSGNGLVQRAIAVVPLVWLAGLSAHLGTERDGAASGRSAVPAR